MSTSKSILWPWNYRLGWKGPGGHRRCDSRRTGGGGATLVIATSWTSISCTVRVPSAKRIADEGVGMTLYLA